MPTARLDAILHLRGGGTSVVVDTRGERLPRIAHWGPDLGVLAPESLAALVDAQAPQRVSGGTDQTAPFSLLPEQSQGWLGTPGLTGHRDGADFSVALAVTGLRLDPGDAPRLVVQARDGVAGVAVTLELEVTASGLVRQRATVRNDGAGRFELTGVLATFPVPGPPPSCST